MLDAQYQDEDCYLSVTARGDFDADVTEAHMRTMVGRARAANQTRILIDAFDISAPKSEFDRYRVGEQFAAIVGPLFRVAVLYPAELINKGAENTAVNRGAKLFVVADKEEALRWLRKI